MIRRIRRELVFVRSGKPRRTRQVEVLRVASQPAPTSTAPATSSPSEPSRRATRLTL